MIDKNKVGARLKELRGERTIEEVASVLGISPSALSNYENGIRTPRDQVKIRIARYYRKSIESIFFKQ